MSQIHQPSDDRYPPGLCLLIYAAGVIVSWSVVILIVAALA